MKKTVSKKTSRIAVIGAGKMATAITVSLVSKGVPASSILAYDVSAAAAKRFTDATGCKTAATLAEALKDASTVLLAVKPQVAPVALKEAGVVDSGGQGLMIFLKGCYACMMGREVTSGNAQEIKAKEDKYTYLTSLTIGLKQAFSQEQEAGFRAYLQAIGDCGELSVKNSQLRLSVKTNDPGLVLQKSQKYGALMQISVLNKGEGETAPAQKAEAGQEKPIHAEAAAFTKTAVPESEWKQVGFIATAVGEGIAEVFRSLGADAIVQGGQTMNPSTEDMLEAIESVPARSIVILPNNKNIILAAQQAQALCRSRRIEVLPTTNIPEGITALSCFMPEDSLEANLSMMRESFSAVKCGEVTYAVRNTSIAGKEIHEGDFMGLGGPDGIYAVGSDRISVLLDMLTAMVDEESGMITLYYGEDVGQEEGEALRGRLAGQYPDCDIDVICGGQPVYAYIVSVE